MADPATSPSEDKAPVEQGGAANVIRRAGLHGILATGALLVIYFIIITLVSGWEFALDQFGMFWGYVVSLSVGFGVQIGLFTYLKQRGKQKKSAGNVVAVSGTTSTVAMISCCTHYLANILPVIGATGLVVFVAQYQVEFFWIGLLANALGIAYITRKIILFEDPKNQRLSTWLPAAIVLAVALVWPLTQAASGPAQVKGGAVAEQGPGNSQGDSAADGGLGVIVSEEGAVTMSVRPLAGVFQPAEGIWRFEVEINTHSVPLESVIVDSVVLIDADGVEHRALEWDGDPPGGHHRSGTLTFGSVSPSLLPAKLVARNIGQVERRVFSWELQ